MRPNMDEYEDLEDAKETNSRAMSWAVLAVAVGGFAALAYYAYHSGSKATAEGEMLVVEADATPIKEAPVDPDGEEFPNKDKTIYDVITPNGSAPAGEKMLPEAEQPVAAMNIEDSEDSAPVAVPPTVAQQPAPSTTTFVAKESATETAAPAVEEQVATKPLVEEKPVAKAPEEKSASNPQIINEKRVVVKKPASVAEKKEPTKEHTKEVAKAPTKPKAESASSEGGSYKIQLGAFKSEEEAQAAWTKISAKHASVLTGSPTIIKAELPNGIFYRLRTGSFDSKADANAACASMSGQACMAVK